MARNEMMGVAGMIFFDERSASKINKICESASPGKIFVDDGSLLGYLRDGKIIPWDSDIDLSVKSLGFERVAHDLENLASYFESIKITLIDDIPMSITFKSEGVLPISLKRFVDVGDGRYYALTAPARAKKKILQKEKVIRLCS